MPGFYQIITPEGALHPVAVADYPDYRILREAVGGDLQLVPYFDHLPTQPGQRCMAYCDEHGKLEGRPTNYPASELWYRVLMQAGRVSRPEDMDDYLVGSIIILWGDDAFMAEA